METADIIVIASMMIALLFLYACDKSFKDGDALLFTISLAIEAYWILVLWLLAIKHLLLCVFFLFFSYFGLCVGVKKFLRGKLYAIMFIIVSMLFIAAICMVFGSYYILSQYKELPGEPGVKYMLFDHKWSSTDWKRTLSLLLTGFKHFFVPVDEDGFVVIHLLQRAVGILITGSVMAWSIDIIRPLVVKEKDFNHNQ